MSKAKSGIPPPQNIRDETGRFAAKNGAELPQRQRDGKGKFVKGNKNGGRPQLRAEFKSFAQEKSYEALQVVYEIMNDAEEAAKDRLVAARFIAEYGYGRPAAEFDRERLELDKARLEADIKEKADKDGPQEPIQLVLSPELKEFSV